MERDVTVRSASLTIVGGQPTPDDSGSTVEVPRGIEHLLLMAAGDGAFEQQLFSNRERALEEAGLRLNDVERATLDAVSDDALSAMIAAVSTNEHTR